MAKEGNSLWIRVLRAKYFKGLSFFQHKLKANTSFGWRDIIKAINWILKGACVHIGDGSSKNVWDDPWISGIEGAVPKPKLEVDNNFVRKVADLRECERKD